MIDQSQEVAALLPWHKGHYRFESGHHGDTWLNLELLCVRPEPVERLAGVLADRLALHGPSLVCGPLVEGAFVAMMVAKRLGLPFAYTERFDPGGERLFSVKYTLPGKLRDLVLGQRVAIVNDVIGAGSAILGTLKDLYACGADPIAIGALATRGPSATVLARENGLILETLAEFTGDMWKPEECPLCAVGMPLTEGAE
jgi:orotate phosphoribosyltransferase